MDEKIRKLTIGGLLHDVGKMVYRTGKGKYHGDLGADFLIQELDFTDEDILNQVRWHHVAKLRTAKLEPDNLAYITCVADNIASGVDRRTISDQTNPQSKKSNYVLKPSV